MQLELEREPLVKVWTGVVLHRCPLQYLDMHPVRQVLASSILQLRRLDMLNIGNDATYQSLVCFQTLLGPEVLHQICLLVDEGRASD